MESKFVLPSGLPYSFLPSFPPAFLAYVRPPASSLPPGFLVSLAPGQHALHLLPLICVFFFMLQEAQTAQLAHVTPLAPHS